MIMVASSFQGLILALQTYWSNKGCTIVQPYDMEIGAATFHPTTFFRSLVPDPWKAAYAQPCRRPVDGRYGENPNRLHHYHQFQVIIKPSPDNIKELYLNSLEAVGLDLKDHDIRFIEDDWESPTLGAAGLGWECWCDGMEISQFTYFQQVAGFQCKPVMVEVTYGLERLCMYLQNVNNVYDLNYNGLLGDDKISYGDIFKESEKQYSLYNFEHADINWLLEDFSTLEKQVNILLQKDFLFRDTSLVLPAYDLCIKASHIFNILDARKALSALERKAYIGRIRAMVKRCATEWMESFKFTWRK